MNSGKFETEIDNKLHNYYLKILQNYNESIFNKASFFPDYSNLSGIFLTAAPSKWDKGKRILVIGRETRGWNVIQSEKPYINLSHYITLSMEKQKNSLLKSMKAKKDKGFTFHNFLRDLGKNFGNGNIGWANLYCFDWKESAPTKKKTPNYDEIIEISERILKATIHILDPDIIIFANGSSSASVRRSFFPISGKSRVCSSPWINYLDDSIEKIELESFLLYGRIQCYRINHPANRSKKSKDKKESCGFLSSRDVRKYLINLINIDINKT